MSQRKKSQKSLSQPSTSFATQDDEPCSQSTQNTSLTDQEHAHHVARVVKYILAADQVKTPILRVNISKNVKCGGKNLRSIMNTVEEVLLDVFGYQLIDKEGKLMLINTIPNEIPHIDFPEGLKNRYVLLFLVLAHIYMNDEVATEGSLRNFLLKLGIIQEGNDKNEVFGDVMTLVTVDFVKEKYLEMEKSENNENDEQELRWGDRAHLEITPRSILEFISKIYEDREIQSWPQQYEKMLRKENNMEVNNIPNGHAG